MKNEAKYYHAATEGITTTVASEFLYSVQNLSARKMSTKTELFERLSKARLYIESHYDKPIQLDDLARVAMLSKYHMLRSYKEAFGITPYKQVLKLRLAKAKEMLEETYSFDEIAYHLGFSDRRSFTKAFKKGLGISPAKYRKSVGNPN